MRTNALEQVSSKWCTFLVRGVVALAIAAWAFTSPQTMAAGLVYVLAAFFIISGVAAIGAGVAFAGAGPWWSSILLGIVQALLGVIMLAQPGMGPLALAYLFAIGLISSGLTELTAAVALRKVIDNEFWLGLLGVITLASGLYVTAQPGLGLLALVYTIGTYGIFAGVAAIGFAFRIKAAGDDAAARHRVPA